MKTVSLSGSLRENVGKKDAKKNRREGKVPCVMYGGKEQLHFVVEEKPLKKIVFTPEVYIINLNVEGRSHDTILQDAQYHPVTDNFLHVDFLEILPEKQVTIAVPVKAEGTPTGVLKGGRFINKMRKLKIKALAKDLPDFIPINTDDLDIGDSIRVSDIKLDNVTFLDAANSVIVGVRTARTVVEEAVPGAPVAEGAGEAASAEGGEKKEGEAAKK
jgi:large subunit ribosomal protein L25